MVDKEYPCVPTTLAVAGPEEKHGPVCNPCVVDHAAASTWEDVRESLPVEGSIPASGGDGGDATASDADQKPVATGGPAASGAGAVRDAAAETAEPDAAFKERWTQACRCLASTMEEARTALRSHGSDRSGAAAGTAADVSAAAKSVSPGIVAFSLCYRLGYEAGLVRRSMTTADISWGNYMDHILEPHNNCHPNNFVLLPPCRGAGYTAAIQGTEDESKPTGSSSSVATGASSSAGASASA